MKYSKGFQCIVLLGGNIQFCTIYYVHGNMNSSQVVYPYFVVDIEHENSGWVSESSIIPLSLLAKVLFCE